MNPEEINNCCGADEDYYALQNTKRGNPEAGIMLFIGYFGGGIGCLVGISSDSCLYCVGVAKALFES